MNTYQICFLLLMIAYVIIFIFERMTGKGIFAKVKPFLPVADALRILVSAMDGVYPSEYFDRANIIMDAAINATKQAENLWRSGALPKDQRPGYCEAVLTESLKEAGIEVTEQVEEVTRGAIALTCMLLPHGTDYPLPEVQEEEA